MAGDKPPCLSQRPVAPLRTSPQPRLASPCPFPNDPASHDNSSLAASFFPSPFRRLLQGEGTPVVALTGEMADDTERQEMASAAGNAASAPRGARSGGLGPDHPAQSFCSAQRGSSRLCRTLGAQPGGTGGHFKGLLKQGVSLWGFVRVPGHPEDSHGCNSYLRGNSSSQRPKTQPTACETACPTTRRWMCQRGRAHTGGAFTLWICSTSRHRTWTLC